MLGESCLQRWRFCFENSCVYILKGKKKIVIRVLTVLGVKQFQAAEVSRYPVGLTPTQVVDKKSHKVIPFGEKKMLSCWLVMTKHLKSPLLKLLF